MTPNFNKVAVTLNYFYYSLVSFIQKIIIIKIESPPRMTIVKT